jgi:hypothetical protein
VVVVAAAVAVYHLRVMRADAASRPPKHEEAARQVTAPAVPAVPAAPSGPTHGRRYVLTVDGATDDDVHQALAGLPPQASYQLTPDDEGS